MAMFIIYLAILLIILAFYLKKRSSYFKKARELDLNVRPCVSCSSENVRAGIALGVKHLRRPLFSLDTESVIPKDFLKIPTVCQVCGHMWTKIETDLLKKHVEKIS